MKRTRYSEEQIIKILKEAEAGRAVKEIVREYGIAEGTFYRWKAKYGGMEVNEAKRLLRKRRKRAEVEVTADFSGEPGGVDPATGVASIDLRAAVDRLDPDDRALIAMRYVAGFNATELAAATGKSPAATRQRLKRLLDRLREDLA